MADIEAAKADSADKPIGNGPHPTLAIVTFLHGILEIVFRAILILLAFAAIIAGGVGQNNTDAELTSSLDIQKLSNSACGWIIFVGIVTLIYEGIFISLRFCNCGFFSKYIQRILWIDFFVSIGFVLAYFAPAVALAVYAKEWDGVLARSAGEVYEGSIRKTRDAVRAAAVFSFFAMFGFIGFAIYIFLFRTLNWNRGMGKK